MDPEQIVNIDSNTPIENNTNTFYPSKDNEKVKTHNDEAKNGKGKIPLLADDLVYSHLRTPIKLALQSIDNNK